MPELLPFQAIRYHQADGDVTRMIAPPYDVLDEGPKQDLLQMDTHNIVAVDLPVTPPKTVGPDEAYDAAGERFRQWLKAGVLKQDEEPGLFAYEQVYSVGGETFRRRGLFATLAVEEFGRRGGGIHRHELTIRGGTDDRLKLMRATEAQLSPVFGIFSDEEGRVVEMLAERFASEPDFHGTTSHDAVVHRCWRVTDPATVEALQGFFRGTDVFIADGHHRYTTALNYSKEHPENPEAGRCLFVLVAMQDPGMIVLPTHRVVCDLQDFSVEALAEFGRSEGLFRIEPTEHGPLKLCDLQASLPEAGHHAMGLYDPVTERSYLLVTEDEDPLKALLPEKPEVWRKLDVAILQHLIVEHALKPRFGGEAVHYKYSHDLGDIRRLSHGAPGRLAVLMQATPLESVCAVSLANEVMPPKSTFFFPKLATGLLINPLWQS